MRLALLVFNNTRAEIPINTLSVKTLLFEYVVYDEGGDDDAT